MRHDLSCNRPGIFLAALGLAVTIVLFTAPAVAGGTHGGGHAEEHGGQHAHGLAFGEPGDASKASRTVEVIASEMAFEPARIEVKSGETVRFIVHNQGKLLHEFNIGTPAVHAAHQQEMQTMMAHGMMTATGMSHPMHGTEAGSHGGTAMPMAHDDPNSILLEPGETKELIWTFTEIGSLEFACNVPGHYQAGMVGRITFD
jgi:uncharacterized cupredoxin-like copper-binding protein